MTGAGVRRWRAGFTPDVLGTFGPLRRGVGDPCWRVADGGLWWVSTTPAGPATLRVSLEAGVVVGRAWGPGADDVLGRLPALLGDEDDDTGFTAHHPLVARARRRCPGPRLGATLRGWDVVVAAVLEQKVTGREAWRSWRELCRRFGEPAPGPVPEPMWAPPSPEALRRLSDARWHQAGVDGGRRRALIACANAPAAVERAVGLRGVAGRELLCRIPGVGVWTAAETAQRAWGDADAVSVGDFHLSAVIGHNLVGHPVDDETMMRELAPYAPQRHRAVCYVLRAGTRPPRRGPRFEGRDYRAL